MMENGVWRAGKNRLSRIWYEGGEGEREKEEGGRGRKGEEGEGRGEVGREREERKDKKRREGKAGEKRGGDGWEGPEVRRQSTGWKMCLPNKCHINSPVYKYTET